MAATAAPVSFWSVRSWRRHAAQHRTRRSRSGWAQDWTSRLRTLLAEAAAQGMPATDIVRGCQAAMADFAFPAAVAEAGNESGGPP
jgi:hypothetical protein